MGKKSKGKKSKGSVNNRCKECRCKECKCKDEIHCYQIRGYSKGSKGSKGKGRKCDKKYTLAHVIGNMLGQTRSNS